MNWSKLRADKNLAHVVPLMAFLIFMGGLAMVVGEMPGFFRNHSDLPWWRRDADQWIYPTQTFLCLGLLAFWWKNYDFNWSLKATLIGAVMGAFGIALWLLPTQLYTWMGFSAESEVPKWMQMLGVEDRREGFDSRIFGADPLAFDCAADYISLILRFFRAVVVVSLVEEIFWRGFLMRWLLNRDGNYWKVPFGKPSWLTYGVVTAAFMVAHTPVDYAGAIAFGTVMYGVAVWTKSMGACVVAHAVANGLMGCYILISGKSGLW